MILEGKKILIMGIRNKWSIAFGIAKSAYENGAKLIFTYMGEENKDKIEELISEFEGSKAYVLDGASEDELVKETFSKIKQENGKLMELYMLLLMRIQKIYTMILFILVKRDFHMLVM